VESSDGKIFAATVFKSKNHYDGIPTFKIVVNPPSQDMSELMTELSQTRLVATDGNLIYYLAEDSDPNSVLSRISAFIRDLDAGRELARRRIFDLDFFKATYEDRINSLIADGKNLHIYSDGRLHAWRRIDRDIVGLWIDNPGKNTLSFEITFNERHVVMRTARDYADVIRTIDVMTKAFQEISSETVWERYYDK
jgi:hypothetical protein